MSRPVALDNVKCSHWPECSHNISSTSKLSNFGPQSHHLSLCKCEEKDIKKSLIICGEKICQPAFKCIFRVDNLFINEILFPLNSPVYAIKLLAFHKSKLKWCDKRYHLAKLSSWTQYFLFWSISWYFFWPAQKFCLSPVLSTEYSNTKNALTLQSSERECIQDYKRNIEWSATTKKLGHLNCILYFT